MKIDLEAMALFAQVVEAGSFTKAAAQCGLSKSAVSKGIGRLENRLGLRLLNRTTRQLSPTEAGEAFYRGCQKVVAEAEAAEQAVIQLAAAPRGVLRVNAPMSFGILHLSPALPVFLDDCPELSIDLTLGDRLVDLVEEGYDLAIRIGVLADSSLVARSLAPSRRLVAAAPAYLETRGRPVSPEDLAAHDCLIYSYQAAGQNWRFRGPGGERRTVPKGRLTVNNGDALRAAALNGQGVAFLPSFIIGDDLRAGRLERLLPTWRDAEETKVYAVYPPARTVPPKVRVFIDFLAALFGEAPYWDEGLGF